MKYIIKTAAIFLILGFVFTSIPAFSSDSGAKNTSQTSILTAANSNQVILKKKDNFRPGFPKFSGFRGNPAWAHNAWTYQLFNFDVETPEVINIVDTLNFQTFCGDFAPGNDELFWVIQYPENILKTINITTGEITDVETLPIPLADGVWTSLSIHKTSGEYFAIATDGTESVLYRIDIAASTIVPEFVLGLQAVISSSFDASGAFYIFDIESDSIFSVDVVSGAISGIGPAGFDGNYAQGMAYDPVGDEIYLSAYEEAVGPQLRKLNRLTGEATFLANLPGETAAFSFPVGSIIPSGIDFGDAPEVAGNLFSFPTTLAHNGAAHIIDPSVFLGNKIDGEPDGQPSANGLGDDTDLFYPSMGDDEDGVTLPPSIFPGMQTTFTVKVSVNGFLDVWMDFDLDHSWFNPSEHVFSTHPITAGNNSLNFVVPPTASPGLAFVRCRFRTDPMPLSFGGLANNGEVEDYVVEIKPGTTQNFDYGDAPQGYGNFHYKTLLSDNGARHTVVPGIFLGSFVDAELDGQPSGNASGDDLDMFYPSQGDDENGVVLPGSVSPGSNSTFEVTASVAGFLDAWMDFDLNGTWDGTNEHIFNTYALMAGSNILQVSIPSNAVPGKSFLRFRFRNNNAPLSWFGPAENGEVEDYALQISLETGTGMDFGDAPEGFSSGSYPTLLTNNGARHIIVPGIYLGLKVDAEPNGQPSLNATGDDADMMYPSQGDDEDGVVFSGALVVGSNASIVVTASVDGFLNAWIDFNIDGNWNGQGEQIFNLKHLVAGSNTISFNVPDDAVSGVSFARFRFQNFQTQSSFTGEVENGEVEDYAVQIQQNTSTGWDFGDTPDELYPTTLANNGARHYSDGITFLGSALDTETDAVQSTKAKGDDLNNLDDEDGIVFQNPMLVGGFATLQVIASVNGKLNAWVDFNRNSSWEDAGEQIFTDQSLLAGVNNLNFLVPGSALSGETFMRFRFGSQTGLSFTGPAENGEVEDYMGTIYPSWNGIPTTLTHIISIPAGLPPLQSGDMLGVFFSDNDGSTKSAGAVVYNQGQVNQLIAFGDNPATPEIKEGLSIGESMSWKLFSSTTSSTHDLEVIYDPLFPDHDGKFKPFGFSALTEINYLENPCDMPQSWSYVVTGSSHNISIPLASNPGIFGEPLVPGDWIGVFYMSENGEKSCGGAIQWNGTANVVVNAYGDDPLTSEKDGFAAGEILNWKIYQCSSMETYSALADYNSALPCQSNFGNFCLSELTSLEALYVQNINLFSGWNGISTYIEPLNPDVQSIFNPYLDKLIIIKNLSSLYWPYSGVNTIGDWDISSGYATKVTDDFSLQITGLSLASKEISLSAGWHYLPVLSECPVNTDEFFAPVMDKITLVQDIIGTKVWWPEMGVFTLQTLLPGTSYKIRLEEPVSLTFPVCNSKSFAMDFSTQVEVPEHWGRMIMTPSSHTVLFSNSSLGSLAQGDVIGAFNLSGILCGFLKVNKTESNQAMILFGNDISTELKDGFDEGELLMFKIYRSQTKEEMEINVIYANDFDSSRTFKNNGINVISEIKISPLTSVESGSKIREVLIYPNPSNGLFHIDGFGNSSMIEVFDVFGKVVYHGEISQSGDLQLSDQPKGVYIMRVENDTRLHFERIIIQ